jgi:hypothetical protein
MGAGWRRPVSVFFAHPHVKNLVFVFSVLSFAGFSILVN